VPVDAATLRRWIRQTEAPVDGELQIEIDPETVNAAFPQLFAGLSAEPKDATFELQNGTPVVVPAVNGVSCCGETGPQLIWDALNAGEAEVTLETQVVEPELTTAEADALGIREPVGGARAFQQGAEAAGPGPGFTTYHAAGEPRVTNIHRMADIVRGTVVEPGETFSINEVVGERTTANGFVAAGAISQGQHVEEIGGGVSQFATTTFNAAYFGGYDITEYQAHSEWFNRYPPGREATMGYPSPDLKFENDSDHGILVWTSYTDTSLTVTLYSTPYATAEQTNLTETMQGQCRVVETTRTRTFTAGGTDTDTFKATYRPGPNLNCEGLPINPEPPPPPG
jgi:vancomycin resistance protein YoaR